ncbi:MAG: hypothetical protein M1812_002707 [Candelaria pacifica]|nr:MAG: hypothetical protein M1812_002707 [Candelaria pacifica]
MPVIRIDPTPPHERPKIRLNPGLLFSDSALEAMITAEGESCDEETETSERPIIEKAHFRLMDLPNELRLMILELLLVNVMRIVNPRTIRTSLQPRYTCTVNSMILRVSSQLYNEGWPLLYQRNVFEFTSEEHFFQWIERGPPFDHTMAIQNVIFNIEPPYRNWWSWNWWSYQLRTSPTTDTLFDWQRRSWWPFHGGRLVRYFRNLKTLTFVVGEDIAFHEDLSRTIPALVHWIKGILEEEMKRDSRLEHTVPFNPGRVEFRATSLANEPAVDDIYRPITSLLKGF